jgi:hypothetical protein
MCLSAEFKDRRSHTGFIARKEGIIEMSNLYFDNDNEFSENMEMMAMMRQIHKKISGLRKKRRKSGGKSWKKKLLKELLKELKELQKFQNKQKRTWSWDSVLIYATPKLIDLFFEKMAEPQIRIIPTESHPKSTLSYVIDIK